MNDQPHQHEPTDPPEDAGETCDLGDIDGLACKAKRYQKQAEVMTQVATDLETWRIQHGEASAAFAEAWENASAERALISDLLEKIRSLLECRLDPDQKECLDSSAEDVFDEVDECSPAPGCQVGDCDFDDTVGEDDDAASLGDRIAAYRRAVEAAAASFTSMVGEADALTSRIAEIKAEVTSLDADASGPDVTKLARWYARYLVAVRDLEPAHVGQGFASVKDYLNCLCKALQCLAAGWSAIAVLEGARAELACLEEAAADACREKKKGVLVAILTGYEECMEEKCPPGTTPDTTPGPTAS